MKRLHALLIALALAVAVVAGTFAALRTTQLGAKATSANRVDAAQIARQNRALDRAEAALRAELKRRPPAIAALPAAAPPPAAQTVIYHRPPPIVHVIHRPGGGEYDHEGGGGVDD
jgi:aminoglycoside phosphotransferase (APT) family kinase protein